MKRTHLLATLAMLLIASAMQAQTINDYMALAQKGDPEAMYQVGYCYWKGIGVAPDADEADKWMEKAAKKGHLDAMHYAGMWINEKYLEKAAKLGHVESCIDFAESSCKEGGVDDYPKNFKKYGHYFEYAIEHGTDEQKWDAAIRRARFYFSGLGLGIGFSKQTALRFYEIASGYALSGLGREECANSIYYINRDY